jgi:hypothetical protein
LASLPVSIVIGFVPTSIVVEWMFMFVLFSSFFFYSPPRQLRHFPPGGWLHLAERLYFLG